MFISFKSWVDVHGEGCTLVFTIDTVGRPPVKALYEVNSWEPTGAAVKEAWVGFVFIIILLFII